MSPELLSDFGLDDFDSAQNGFFRLGTRHGWTFGYVARPRADSATDELWMRVHRYGDAHVHNDHARTNMF